MSKHPEALRLAHALEECLECGGSSSDAMGLTVWSQKQCDLAAAELRRLHSANAELLRVLRLLDTRLRDCDMAGISATDAYDSFYREEVEEVLALATAEAAKG